jgi:hypothetical protein
VLEEGRGGVGIGGWGGGDTWASTLARRIKGTVFVAACDEATCINPENFGEDVDCQQYAADIQQELHKIALSRFLYVLCIVTYVATLPCQGECEA